MKNNIFEDETPIAYEEPKQSIVENIFSKIGNFFSSCVNAVASFFGYGKWCNNRRLA